MTSWHLNIWKFKIWLSQERNELSKWNKKTFFLVSQVLSFRQTIQTSKNVADTTFKKHNFGPILGPFLPHKLQNKNFIKNFLPISQPFCYCNFRQKIRKIQCISSLKNFENSFWALFSQKPQYKIFPAKPFKVNFQHSCCCKSMQ